MVVANTWVVYEVGVMAAYAVYELASLPPCSCGFARRTASRWAVLSAAWLRACPAGRGQVAAAVLADSARLGFLGISYVTFRSLDVIFGIQDRLIVGLSPAQYLAYLFFFPTISSGPIDRYRRFATTGNAPHACGILVDLDGAVHRIFTGFLYKFILAALIQQYWLDR